MADKQFLSVRDVATMLGVPIRTVYGWRMRGAGPPGYRVGKHVRFALADVEAWLASRRDPE